MDKVLLYFSLKYNGDWNKIYNALDQKEKVDKCELLWAESKLKNNKINFTTILNSEYPNNLRLSCQPSFVLFYVGDIKELKTEKFSNWIYQNWNEDEKINLNKYKNDNLLISECYSELELLIKNDKER